MNNDTIYRQAALDAICEHGTDLERRGITVLAVANHKQATVDLLENLPSAERRGRWEHYEHREPQYDIEGYKTWAEAYKCSNCGFIHTVIEDFGHYAYCPNCGARMEASEWTGMKKP